MANNVAFGNKEQYLEWLNPFITANFAACQDYLDQVAMIVSNAPAAKRVEISSAEKTASLENLLKHVQNVQQKLKEKVHQDNRVIVHSMARRNGFQN